MKREHLEALDAVHVGGPDDLVRDGLDRGREDGHQEPGLIQINVMTIIAKVFPGALPRKSIGSIPILVSKELISRPGRPSGR